jgi:predicted DNA-binding WGR domain protein
MSVSTTSAPSTPTTRRFEFVGGNSAKFWQVTVNDCSVTVRFGRLGTDGQVQTKEFPSAEAASGHTERLIAQKTAKGYQEASAV